MEIVPEIIDGRKREKLGWWKENSEEPKAESEADSIHKPLHLICRDT